MGRPERRLGDLEGALEVVPGEDVVPELLRDPRPVPERLGQLGVGRAERLLLDPERALDQRQGRRLSPLCRRTFASVVRVHATLG